jgi:hypothetical protein
MRLRGHEMAETVHSTGILHAPGRLHIGVSAHFVWTFPPNYGRTARRHVHVYKHTTGAYPTVADAMIETLYPMAPVQAALCRSILRPKALRRICRARPGVQQDCGYERGGDAAQEDTRARSVHKKLLVECVSAHGGNLPEDGLGKKLVVAKEVVGYDVQRRCIKGEGLHKRTLMHNCVFLPMHP